MKRKPIDMRKYYADILKGMFKTPTKTHPNILQFLKFAQKNIEELNQIILKKDNFKDCLPLNFEDIEVDIFMKKKAPETNNILKFIVDAVIEIIIEKIELIYEQLGEPWQEEYPISIRDVKEKRKIFKTKWYRGQSNYKWGLVPSFIRYIKTEIPDIITVDQMYLYNDYKSSDIIDRINKILEPPITAINNLNYDKISYIQHSLAYSPLLDFTQSFPIALSFALGNTDTPFEYNNYDSAVFELEIFDIDNNILIDESSINKFLSSYKIHVCTEYLLGTPINGQQIITINDLIEIITPKYKLIEVQTNDRMKYQKGKFILFHDCLVINQTMLVELNPQIKFRKYKIDVTQKRRRRTLEGYSDSLKDILHREYPEYDIDSLMDPYKYVRE